VKARLIRFSLCSALVGVLVLGCSSSDSSTAPPPGPVAPAPGTQADLDAAIGARAASYCDRVFACCEAASKTVLLTLYAGEDVARDKCEAKVKEWLKSATTAAATSLQRKDLDFFPSKEDACQKDEQAKTCDEFFALGSSTEPKIACPAAFTGKTKEGAGCTLSASCASGYCKLDGESGICAKFPEEGDDCGGTTECGGGDLFCFRTTAPPACKFVQGKCKPRESKADGQSCCNPEECAGQTCSVNQKGQPVCNQQNRLMCSK
jgi:hypothetical protein